MAIESVVPPTAQDHAKRVAKFIADMQVRGSMFLEYGRLEGFPAKVSYNDYLIEVMECVRAVTTYARDASLKQVTWEAPDGTQMSGSIAGWYFNYGLEEEFTVGIATFERTSSGMPNKVDFSRLRSIGGVSLAELSDK